MPDVVGYLRRFVATFVHVTLRPVSFFTRYLEIVQTRKWAFFHVHEKAANDPHIAPVAFAAIAIGISNLLLSPLMSLGRMVGAVSRNEAEFYEMAREQGALAGPSWTGLGVIDDVLLEVLKLATFYLLGVLMWLFSGRKIPVGFATGYYFYVNAWTLIGSLASLGLLILATVMPLYETPLPQLVQLGIGLVFMFMMLGFPIVFWPRMLEIERRRVAIAVVAGFIVWIGAVAILAATILPPPEIVWQTS